jgi:predicted nucleic acid-binding protein
MSADFLDSNIFLYLFDETDRAKRNKAERLILGALSDGTGCISFQVVQETLNIITSKLRKPASPDDARCFLENILLPLWKIFPSAGPYSRCLEIQARYRFGFYDSLIIAAALEGGCTRLLSEDLQHGQKIETMTIVNPFKT